MTELFIQVYVDEDVDVLVAELLRAHGHVATTTLDEGQRGKSDAEQLAYAASHGKAIVSLTGAIPRLWHRATRRGERHTTALSCRFVVSSMK